jgi:hypothetical protein
MLGIKLFQNKWINDNPHTKKCSKLYIYKQYIFNCMGKKRSRMIATLYLEMKAVNNSMLPGVLGLEIAQSGRMGLKTQLFVVYVTHSLPI